MEEWSAIYHLKNDKKNIVIKSVDKFCVVAIWDKNDYIKDAEKQLGDTDEVCNEMLRCEMVSDLL